MPEKGRQLAPGRRLVKLLPRLLHLIAFVVAHTLVEHAGADAAHHPENQETLGAPAHFQHRAEGNQAEHVAENVAPAAVQEHIRHELPGLKIGRADGVQAAYLRDDRQEVKLGQKKHDVRNQQSANGGSQVEHRQSGKRNGTKLTVPLSARRQYRQLSVGNR